MTKNRRNKMKARALAASSGSNYTSALRQVTSGWTLFGAVTGDAEGILEKQVPGIDLDVVGDLVSLNADLRLFEATVQSMVANFDTLVVEETGEYEGGTVTINATVEAELVWEGLMMKAQAYSAVEAGQVEFIDADFNDHYSLVQVTEDEPVTVVFIGVADPHAESIESLEFEGATVGAV